ncbi:hypothetical protein FGO68_gene2078 [Halteria grandinella]|uniref:Uncharacterized protein n=1 Tax=Halteria grandinella TaxID=5974 RepID=A0A8J8T616_HALGN|nr:hypothetical protein FGO68_gene2078 [Halteria grandinella]
MVIGPNRILLKRGNPKLAEKMNSPTRELGNNACYLTSTYLTLEWVMMWSSYSLLLSFSSKQLILMSLNFGLAFALRNRE